MPTVAKHGKIELSDQELLFIKNNFKSMTNNQMALHLGISKFTLRRMFKELGINKAKYDYWSDEAVDYLIKNYKVMGNVEIINYLSIHFPKAYGWNKRQLQIKLAYLGLKRDLQDLCNITERNRKQGVWGNPNPKKEGRQLKAIVTFKEKKYLLSPGQTKQDLFDLIVTNQIQPIEI